MASSAAANDQIYFSAIDNVTTQLVQKINAETVRIDMSAWYLTERSISIALVNRFKAGVPVRLLGDRGSIFEIDQLTRREFYWLASQGLPIRLRSNPTWYPEIDHWKATIFAGQHLVAFGSGNYTPFELAPFSTTNYKDEIFLFTNDPSLVGAFKTKFDRMWNDTTPEPLSLVAQPPYFRNWNQACALESVCADYKTLYPTPAPMTIDTARLEPDYPLPPDLVWGQGPIFNNRLVQEINAETNEVNLVSYRLTVDNITIALVNKFNAGVPVRIIMEPNEYLNRKWPEFWLTHANMDKLWAAGVPIKKRVHAGLTHMKTLITSKYATVASSNFAAAWQRDNNYFLPAASKPAEHAKIKARFDTMWNDPTGFAPFVPLPPDAAILATPASGATGLAPTTPLVWKIAAFAVSYDVYLGTSQSGMTRIANVPAQLVNSPPATYSWTPSPPLQSGTTFFWKVVSRTNATAVNPSISATSSIRSFSTGGPSGGVPPPPPPPPPPSNLPAPWTTQNVGAVGATGSATYASGAFSVSGAGSDIWGSADSFRYVSQPITGNSQITARVVGLQNTNSFAKAGVMLRESLSPGSAHVVLDVRPDGTIELMTRSATGGSTAYLAGGSLAFPAWLRLARSGGTVTASISSNGGTWTTVGSTSLAIGTGANIGLVVTSHDTSRLSTATFDNVAVTSGGAPPPPPPPPPPSATNVVIYASDIPASARHGSWTTASNGSSPNGVSLATPDAGVANTVSALATPTDYVDVTFTAAANTPYTIWLRVRALNNSKLNDALWLQFSDARVGGSAVYPMGSTSALLVNLATDGTGASINGWGWQNTAYWLSQSVTVTFANSGSHTLRIQVREDGVQWDQIVLSPTTYLIAAPGPVAFDTTIVPKS